MRQLPFCVSGLNENMRVVSRMHYSVVKAYYVFGILSRKLDLPFFTYFTFEFSLFSDHMHSYDRPDCFIFDIIVKILVILCLESSLCIYQIIWWYSIVLSIHVLDEVLHCHFLMNITSTEILQFLILPFNCRRYKNLMFVLMLINQS